MKITTFNPLIVTKDAENVIKLFEALGFEKRHSLDANTGNVDFTSVRMKDANGFYVDVANVPVPQDMTLIRINVDDFDEAYKFLTERGFTKPGESKVVETKTNKSIMMISPSGFAFDLCQHIKE
jgi:predicted enzyme related to lactoylglutathione lyase